MAVHFLSIAASAANPTSQPSIPRKTGNLTIDQYRFEFLKGQQPVSPDPLLRDPARIKFMGATSIEDYPTLDVLEPVKGQPHFAPFIANAEECRKLQLQYAIYPWVHFYPDWVAKEDGFTPYTNLEDGSTCRQPSGWAPYTTQLTEHYYKLMADGLGQYVDAIYVTDCNEYGELGYPVGYTKWLRPDDNSKKAWWCGDQWARQDFRDEQLKTQKNLAALNTAWGTTYQKPDEIDYPLLALLKSNPDPRKRTPQQRRRILDFVYWYQDASPRRVKKFIQIAQSHFPGKPCEIKLGHGEESAMIGYSPSSIGRILKGTPRLAIRSTHASVSYFHVQRVATAAHCYGFDFLTEPPGVVKPERMAERIFMDACAGVAAYFDYPANPTAAGDAFTRNINLLDGQPAQVDVALFFAEADHYLRIEPAYPAGLLEVANYARDVADYHILDERLIADNMLKHYSILVIPGDPLIEETTFQKLVEWIDSKPNAVILQIGTKFADDSPVGTFTCVDGRQLTLPTKTTERATRRITAEPTSDEAVAAVQKAYADLLSKRGLDQKLVEILTTRDGLLAGIFRNRILLYNTNTDQRIILRQRVTPSGILQVMRDR